MPIVKDSFLGFVIVGLGLIAQSFIVWSMLGFHMFLSDLKDPNWWIVVVLPLAFGVAYLSVGLKFNGQEKKPKYLVMGAFVASLLVFPIYYFVTVLTIAAVIFYLLTRKKGNET